MLTISATEAWKSAHPGAAIGLLEISNVAYTDAVASLELKKREIEGRIIDQFGSASREELTAQPVMAAYKRYYRQFKKTYHVLLQVESIAQKKRKLPNVSPLVDANFMAEVETFVLTAGHDVGRLNGEVVIDIAREGDQMTQMNGSIKMIPAGDMIMRDAEGISCSILYGQDNRSSITKKTSHALYVGYGPPGMSTQTLENHLQKILENVRLFSRIAVMEQMQLLIAQ